RGVTRGTRRRWGWLDARGPRQGRAAQPAPRLAGGGLFGDGRVATISDTFEARMARAGRLGGRFCRAATQNAPNQVLPAGRCSNWSWRDQVEVCRSRD